ncbi:hypothetical protein BDN70DRAFT_892316 [Pholiota conissans]|uniref:Fungal-type protein kinase domain-containing protein n=1 Tax=Pholiota conissans TaxID=109636 RepID=A0A9P5Z9H5_9AGAR|nr:hypothetical protein BDN70DRAFT_892316 [Pholiota conissans]
MTSSDNTLPEISKAWLDSPIALPKNDELYYTDKTVQSDRRHELLCEDNKKSVVGPMPVHDFLSTFSPLSIDHIKPGMPSTKGAFKDVPRRGSLYGSLVHSLNKDKDASSSSRCPGIKFVRSGNHSERFEESGHEQKNNIYGYSPEDCENNLLPGFVQLIVKLAPEDFVCDTSEKIFGAKKSEYTPSYVKRIFGQQVTLAIEIFARQHRNSLHSIFMTPTHARFLLWGHAGVIISEAFRLFEQAIKAHVRIQLGDNLSDFDKEYARYYLPNKVVRVSLRTDTTDIESGGSIKSGNATQDRMEDESDSEKLDFLISRPVVSPSNLVCNGTRGYWAVDIKTGYVQFLKDVWIAGNTDEDQFEGNIL